MCAAVDHGAGEVAVWESGAVLQWLAERDPARRLLPADPHQRIEVLSWLYFQVVSLKPRLHMRMPCAWALPWRFLRRIAVLSRGPLVRLVPWVGSAGGAWARMQL